MNGRDVDDDEDRSILQLVSDDLSTKFHRHAPPLVRLSLRTIFLGPLACVLALISLIAFIHLRRTHVPKRSFTTNVQLQYPAAPDIYTVLQPVGPNSQAVAGDAAGFQGQKDLNTMRIHHPYGLVDGLSTHLVPNQAYDVSVELVLPRSPRNADAGNFMIAVDLIASEHQPPAPPTRSTVATSRIPAVMTYVPPFVDKMRQLLKAPLLIVGLGKEEEHIQKTVLERVSFGKKQQRPVPDALRLEVQRQGWSGEVMEVSEAKVEFTAGFSGLRYLLHAWPVTSFLILAPLFFCASLSTAVITLSILSTVFAPSHVATDPVKKRSESPDATPIKREDDGSAAFSSGLSFLPSSSSANIMPGMTTETATPVSSSGSAADGEESDSTLKVDTRNLGNGQNDDSEEDDFVLGEADALTPKGDGFGRGMY